MAEEQDGETTFSPTNSSKEQLKGEQSLQRIGHWILSSCLSSPLSSRIVSLPSLLSQYGYFEEFRLGVLKNASQLRSDCFLITRFWLNVLARRQLSGARPSL